MSNSMSQKRMGMVLSYANIIVFIGVSFLYTPIMIRILGQSEYGIYSLASSIVGYFALLNMGFSSTYMRYYAYYKAKAQQEKICRLNGMFLLVFLSIGLFVFLAGTTLAFQLDVFLGDQLSGAEYTLTRTLVLILSLNMAIMMPGNVYTAIVVSQERFVFAKGIELLRTLCSPLIALPLLFYGYGSIGMSASVLLITVVSVMLNIYYCYRILSARFDFSHFDWSLFKDMAGFSFFILLQGIMDQFNWHVGKVVLANICGTAAVAVYSVGLQFNSIFTTFSTAICGVFTPQIHQLKNMENALPKLNELFIEVGRGQFYIVFFILSGIIFFGRGFICLWVGEEYEGAYYIALLLMLPIALALMQNIAVEMLRAYNKHGWWNIINVIMAGINVAISIPLTMKYGEYGTAIATCITMGFLTMVIHQIYYQRTIGLDIMAFLGAFRGFLLPGVVTSSVALLLCYVFPVKNWLNFFLNCMIFALVYWSIMFYFAANIREREMIYAIVRKCIK